MRGGEFRLDREVLGRVEDLRIPGAFQRRNALVALGMARLAGVPAERLAALVGDLRAPSHRLEDLGLRGGHRVWDNGVSTTPDSTLAVYESLSSPVCLLAGGKSKDLPLEALASLAKGKVARVVAFGHAGAVLRDAFHAEGIEAVAVPTVRAAVAEAYARMQPGEELLFSPACASFDAYKNFKERAEDFRQALPAADAGDSA